MYKEIYFFDEDGIYAGVGYAQGVKTESGIEYRYPTNCTSEKPIEKEGYWSKMVEGNWEYLKKPSTIEEVLASQISLDSTKVMDVDTLEIMKKLVDNKVYRFMIKDRMAFIEKIPEPSKEELVDILQNKVKRALDDTQYMVSGDYVNKLTPKQLNRVLRYRQELRDLNHQKGFPYEVEFPELDIKAENSVYDVSPLWTL